MPIKFPKSFARRKSSSNALDEFKNDSPTGESSFKVFERSDSKTFDGLVNFRRTTAIRPLSSPGGTLLDASYSDPHTLQVNNNHNNNKNRASGGTNHSASTGYFDSSSSARLSSSSTLPSSTDGSLHNEHNNTYSRQPTDKSTAVPSGGQLHPHSHTPRDRATTTSTSATAKPKPSSFIKHDLEADLDDFRNMFAAIASNPQLRSDSPQRSQSPNPIRELRERSHPAPINVDRSQSVEPGPYSWGRDSHTSNDGLMDTRRQTSPYSRDALDDARQRLVNNSSAFNASSRSYYNARSSPGPSRGLKPVALYDKAMDDGMFEDGWKKESLGASSKTIRRAESPESVNEELEFSAALATQYEDAPPSPPKHLSLPPQKVMTPAEFEKYRQQKEDDSQRWSNYSPSEASAEEEDRYDEEDEQAKTKEMAVQRRKQEAHLSVYRQQMMKVTGEQPMKLSSVGAATERSASTPNLSISMSMTSLGQGRSSEPEEEDEDVPLGILAAHGFPNKNRPPVRLTQTSSNPNLRASMMHAGGVAPPGTAAGDAARRSQLPAFARQLPQDPYLGSSLVNQSNREPLAMGGGAPSVYGGAPRGLPPGGLVGVIAEEERAKALRRASPNAQPMAAQQQESYFGGVQGLRQSQTMGAMASPAPMAAPGDQAQAQMSQQMNQMMQMQMQWMQAMQSMWNGQGMPPQTPGGSIMMPPMMPGLPQSQSAFLAPPGQFPQRPVTVGGSMQDFGRTMSMANLNPAQRGSFAPSIHQVGPGYAPSLAPSERSNIGLAPRYRPVSTAVDAGQSSFQPPQSNYTTSHTRTSTLGNKATPALRPDSSSGKTTITTTIRTVSPDRRNNIKMSGGLRPVQAPRSARSRPTSIEGDEDEEGWAEMKRKRDAKRREKMDKGKGKMQAMEFEGLYVE